MNEKVIIILITIIIIVAIVMIYRMVNEVNEKVSDLKVEVSGQFNKMERNINAFADNVKNSMIDNIEQLRKITMLNKQLENNAINNEKSNILLVSDTGDGSYYMSETTTSFKETENTPAIVMNEFPHEETNQEVDKKEEEVNDKKEGGENEEINKSISSSSDSESAELAKEDIKIKPIDNYKLIELRKLAKKFNIPIKEEGKQKYLSKAELYERIKNFSK